MLRKLKEPKRKSIAMSLMRDVQGSAAEKLRMFEKMRAAGGFTKEDPAELAKAEKMLREFVAMEKKVGGRCVGLANASLQKKGLKLTRFRGHPRVWKESTMPSPLVSSQHARKASSQQLRA